MWKKFCVLVLTFLIGCWLTPAKKEINAAGDSYIARHKSCRGKIFIIPSKGKLFIANEDWEIFSKNNSSLLAKRVVWNIAGRGPDDRVFIFVERKDSFCMSYSARETIDLESRSMNH